MSQTAPAPADVAARYAPKPPKAVQSQVDAVEGLYKPEPPAPAPGEPPALPATPPAAAPAQPPAATPSPPPAPPVQRTAEEWEQRERSALGRLEQEAAISRQQAERISRLEELIATMQARGVPSEPASPPPPPAKPNLLTPEEVTEYGEEMLGVVAKKAREEFVPELDALRLQVADLTNRLNGTVELVTTQKTQTVYQTLDAWSPQWPAINGSEEFKQWLAQTDEWSGKPRRELLSDAFTRQDGKRVLRFFQGFAEAAGLPQPSQAAVAATPPAQPGPPVQPTLEELAAPGRARSAPQGQQPPPEKPIYSSADITKFMADKISGKWKGREADAAAVEQDIFRAQHEGRIVG